MTSGTRWEAIGAATCGQARHHVKGRRQRRSHKPLCDEARLGCLGARQNHGPRIEAAVIPAWTRHPAHKRLNHLQHGAPTAQKQSFVCALSAQTPQRLALVAVDEVVGLHRDMLGALTAGPLHRQCIGWQLHEPQCNIEGKLDA